MRRTSREELLRQHLLHGSSSDPNLLTEESMSLPERLPRAPPAAPPTRHVTPPPAAQRGRRGSAHTRPHAASLLRSATPPRSFLNAVLARGEYLLLRTPSRARASAFGAFPRAPVGIPDAERGCSSAQTRQRCAARSTQLSRLC